MKKLLLLLTMASVALVAVAVFVVPQASATAAADHWYVCKWVGPPGNDETLQTGGNPIFVDASAVKAQTGLPDVHIGDAFSDAQTHSRVIAGPYSPPGIDPEPVCPTTPVTTTSPPPTTTPPPPACPGSVTLGPWYGDPRVNITLKGAGTFVVSGGVQRFTGLHTITKTLACNETFKIGRYKISRGHFLTITLNGVQVTHVMPPVLR